MSEPLYLGLGGHVVAIDRTNGTELWRQKVARGGAHVTITVDATSIYAGTSGELVCLDRKTGDFRWHNKLKGLGHGFITFGGSEAAAMHASDTRDTLAQTAMAVGMAAESFSQ